MTVLLIFVLVKILLGKIYIEWYKVMTHFFSEILKVAHKVAEGSTYIANVSQSIAESAHV